MASAYLERTATSGNQKTATFSGWFKKCSNGVEQVFYHMRTDSSNFFRIRWDSSDILNGVSRVSGTDYYITATRKFRDSSAYYHIVFKVDTTQATASDRLKFYVNGEEVTVSASNYPAQNLDLQMNVNSMAQRVGQENGGNYFDGLMTHVHWTDGYAYPASTFGETDSTSGIWKPKTSPSVTYGTNGFFLKMENSSDMGEDNSGNNNDFTTSGTITQTEDTPSNNFVTMNPLQVRVAPSGTTYPTTFSNGNTKNESSNTSAYTPAVGTLGVSSGKWYFECKMGTLGYTAFADTPSIGIKSLDAGLYDAQYDDTIRAYVRNGNKVLDSTTSSFGNTYTTGDIIGVALDLDNGAVYFSKNGTFQNSGDPTSGASKTGALATDMASYENWSPFCMGYNGGSGSNPVWEWNFGNGYFGTTAVASSNSDSAGLGLFEYSVPSGYYALCTKNIKNYG